jgi:hypothetical protein
MQPHRYPLKSAQALPHFAKTLAYADSTISEKFQTMSTKGQFFSLAPEGLDDEIVLNFDGCVMPAFPKIPSNDGKYLISEITTLTFDLASVILQRAQRMKSPTLYLHEPYLKKDEPNTELSKALTAVGEHLFFMKPIRSVSAGELEDKIHNYSVTWHSLAILVDKKEPEPNLELLLSDAVLITVGAYKGESYLYWTT